MTDLIIIIALFIIFGAWAIYATYKQIKDK